MLQAKANKNNITQAKCLQQMGQVLYHRGNYATAIDYLLEADKIFRATNQTQSLAQNFNYLGNIYYYNKQPEQATTEFNKALLLFQQLKDNNGLAETYGQIGHIYEKKLAYDSAYYYHKLALTHLLQQPDSNGLAKIYENIGSIMEDKLQYDSALYYYAQSLQLYQRFNNNIAQIEVINNLGDVYRKTGNYKQGLVYAKNALQRSIQLQEKYQQSSAYRDIARSYQMLNQYDSAFFYTEQSRALLQDIYSIENAKQIALMQTLFETEKKSTEITKLQAERKVNVTIIVATIIVLILLAYLARQIYKRQKMVLKNERLINDSNQQILSTKNGLLEAELTNKLLQETNLKQELEIKGKELSSHILHLIQKNEMLETLKTDLNDLLKDDKRDQKKQIRQVLQKINFSFNQDVYWEEFRLIFDKVHQSFFANIQQICPDLSATELRLLALIKTNLGSQDVATLLGITPDSLRVTRYRIKKKLKLGADESLSSFIQTV